MLEEIEFQGINKCKIVGLPDKQEIEKCISPEMPVRIAYEKEECIEEEICDVSYQNCIEQRKVYIKMK